MLLDRYGGQFDTEGVFNDRGKFLAESGVPFTNRTMLPVKEGTILTTYRVKKLFEVDAGDIAPWFGEKGGAQQFFTKNKTIGELIDSGHLEVVDRKIVCP